MPEPFREDASGNILYEQITETALREAIAALVALSLVEYMVIDVYDNAGGQSI
jgi:hypothetical protein